MHRLPRGYLDDIAAAYTLLPAPLAQRVAHVEFLCGVEPAYVGLHRDDMAPIAAGHRLAGSCIYAHNQIDRPADERRTTVCLPTGECAVDVVVHELGHALHEAIGFWPAPYRQQWVAAPVTPYAQCNSDEAFAEAFTLWIYGHERYADEVGDDPLHRPLYLTPDARAVALFEALAA